MARMFRNLGAGLLRGATADVLGMPVDTLNMIRQGLLAPAEGGNPMARSLTGLLGPVQQTGSSDYFAQQMGLPQGEGPAYEMARMVSPSPTDIMSAARRAPTMQELITYHGTPHRFEPTPANPLGEFEAAKIGTGEGVQAYGHGVYLAESPEVAKGYQRNLTDSKPTTMTVAALQDSTGSASNKQLWIIDEGDVRKATADDVLYLDPDRQVAAFAENEKDALRLARKYDLGEIQPDNVAFDAGWSGSLYTADLPDEMIDRMLDWHKPLSEQPENIRQALLKELPKPEPADGFDMGGNARLRDNRNRAADKSQPYPWLLESGGKMFGLSQKDVDRMFGSGVVNEALTGEQIITRLAQAHGGQAKASERLKALGIPGIKYLDAGSRGDKGKGTRNFVVFPGEEKKVKILKRE